MTTLDESRDSADFKLGMAYAVHLMLHTIGHAHGETDMGHIADVEPNECCQTAVLNFALGLSDALAIIAGGSLTIPPHRHLDEVPG